MRNMLLMLVAAVLMAACGATADQAPPVDLADDRPTVLFFYTDN